MLWHPFTSFIPEVLGTKTLDSPHITRSVKPCALKNIPDLRLVGTSRWKKAEGLWFGYSAVPRPQNRRCVLGKQSQLFLLPDSVTTPTSSLWRRACRITTTTTGMTASSDFSNVLVATELFPLTGSPKSPAGKQ